MSRRGNCCGCGCIQTKDELTINADGSGQVRLETKTSMPAELTEQMSSRGQMGAFGGGVVYLCSAEASFVTGSELVIDGAFSAV